MIPDPCNACRGAGTEQARRDLEVKVPPGVDTGMRIPIRGEGEAGHPGSARGDLELVIRVADHPDFQRDGDNLVCQVPITYSQAALGGELRIPTLTEAKAINLPRGTQSHNILRLPGLGMPNVRTGRRGDLLVQVVIETPVTLTDRQEELLRELAEIENKNVTPARKSFLERVKSFFNGDD